MHHIFSKDKDGEEEIYNLFLNSKFAANQFNTARIDAFRLFLKTTWEKENHLDELLELMKANPENHYVINYVAQVYLGYGEYKRAANYFEMSASVANTQADKFIYLLNASLAHVKSGDKVQSVSPMKDCISIAREDDNLSVRLLETLAELSKELNNSIDYKIFTEALLEKTPSDHNRRYSLAYEYGETKDDDGAIFHYRLLSTRFPTGAVWNNLGVSLSKLNLNGLAVSSYREAEKLNESLAMSNLAHKFINVGFLDEATEITNRAVLIKDYDQTVGGAISSIKETRLKEDKEQTKLIESLRKKRQFFVDYSAKYLLENVLSLPEFWQSPQCTLKLSIDNGILEMTGEFDEAKQYAPTWNPVPTFPASNKEPEKNYIKYIGKINGFAVKFDYWISKGKMPQTEIDKPKGSGLMIIEDNKQIIRVYEISKKDESAFTEIIAHDPQNLE